MKTKKFDLGKEIEKVVKQTGDDDVLLAIHRDDKNKNLNIFIVNGEDDDANLVCTLAAIIETSLTGNGDEGLNRVARVIIEALKTVQVSGNPIAGLRLSAEMLDGVVRKMSTSLEETGAESGCTTCEMNRTCEDDDAVAYRKAHGIPRPKKGGKARKVNVN